MNRLYTLGMAVTLWMTMSIMASAQTLSAGMSGEEVESLQNSLVAAGYLARTVDGDYGSTTVKAVSFFQEDHGLTVTGKADDRTQEAIRKAENQGYRDGGGIVYAEGNRGDKVAELQNRLIAAGYLKDSADGVYGNATSSAVKQFQKDHRLPVSGAIDEQTLSLLSGGADDGKHERKESDKNAFLYTKGDRGDKIEALQRKLKRAGYLDGEADGIYGSQTFSAVQSLQGDHGLTVSGSVDEGTMEMIDKLGAKGGSSENSLKQGDRGKNVIRLQNSLLLHGYNPGGSDGVYGEATARAVRELQQEEKLAKTGMADGDVWERLENAPKFTGKYKKVFRMRSTAYTPNDGGGSGRTALGNYAGKGHAAVDPDVIPLGSIVYIEGYGYAICDDIGGAIQGKIIDVGVDTLEQAYQWGTRDDVNVYLVS